MSSTNYLQGHSSTAKAPGSDDSWAGKEPGPYIAVVKITEILCIWDVYK